MVRGAALLLVCLLAAGSTPPPDPLIAIMVAEDRRMALPPDLHTPAIDALRASLAEDVRMLVELTASKQPAVRNAAIRALGRYENRELTATILQFLPLTSGHTGTAATALAQSLRGAPLPADTAGEQVQMVLEALADTGEQSLAAPVPLKYTGLPQIARAIARLPFSSPAQVDAAESFLLLALRRVDVEVEEIRNPLVTEVAGALESLARLNIKLAPRGPAAVERLQRIVLDIPKYGAAAAENALEALVAARGVDESTLRSLMRRGSVTPAMRRLVTLALGGAGSPITGEERTGYLATLLGDSALAVRIEAVRAWARTQAAENGCNRLLDMLRDPELPVVLVVIDTLGDVCKQDQNVTDRLTVEARTPPGYAWHREAHALVALARRSPDRAGIAVLGFVKHGEWHVRMYAARAAAITGDVATLERLAADPVPNVREAALPRLRALRGPASDALFASALQSDDYQLLRTAANELKGGTTTGELVTALVDALKRVTAEQKETSRDARLALLERLQELGGPDQAAALVPLMRDYDITVAIAAAAIVAKWTGEAQEVAPQLLPRPAPPQLAELAEVTAKFVRIKLSSGLTLKMSLRPDEAPLTSIRFFRLVRAGYFNRLTLHRIVPNFVVQGGSPGANEYSGDSYFGRDEIGRLRNDAGTVGLSTRGRDTGDAQFYFNLVDNPRLDYEYTVFGTVGALDDVQRILEGDTIQEISFEEDKNRR